MATKKIKFTITALADYHEKDKDGNDVYGDRHLCCTASKIMDDLFTNKAAMDYLKKRFNGSVEAPIKYHYKSYLDNLRFERGVDDEIED